MYDELKRIARARLRAERAGHAVARKAEKRGGGEPVVTLLEDTAGEEANALVGGSGEAGGAGGWR